MIFVTLGTQDKPFSRLLMSIEQQIILGNINEEVIVQAGYTKFESKKMKLFDLVSQDQFSEYMEKSRLVISHGGVGSILTALKFGKTVIAAPRLAKYGEHLNDHQLQIIRCFEDKNFILPLYDFDKLNDVLIKAEKFIPDKYISNNSNFINMITKIIEE